jgi:AGZA family xanthine/uracil permease-like MFS transporter
MEVLSTPVVGLVALSVLLTALVAKLELPGRIPGALAALLIAGSLHYAMVFLGLLGEEHRVTMPEAVWLPTGWLDVFTFEWTGALRDSLKYMPIVIPFALATVIGGIDCTESAAAAGDDYDTRVVVGIEAIATLVAALCGGVIQTTPYIGHPAYKAMGGRAAYALATALLVGSAGVLGYFAYFYALIPKPTVFPILIFIGLEITAQSFQATKKSHYPAIVLACVPALAALVLLYIDKVFGDLVSQSFHDATGQQVIVSEASLRPETRAELATLRVMANGFILTSLLWASFLAAVIDHRLRRAATYLVIAGGFSLFGLMHSPFPGSPTFLPWSLPNGQWELPVRFACGYLLAAILLCVWDLGVEKTVPPPDETTP